MKSEKDVWNGVVLAVPWKKEQSPWQNFRFTRRSTVCPNPHLWVVIQQNEVQIQVASMSFRSRAAGLSLLSVFLWRFTGASDIIPYQDFIFILVHKTKISDNKYNVTNMCPFSL